MSNENNEILEEFIIETREHLAQIEPDLLEMEKTGKNVDHEIVNRIFRAIHSTKGGASFLSFESLKNLSHVMENVLMQIRDGALEATPDVVDALLRSVDVLRAMIDDVQASDQIPFQTEVAALNAILDKNRVEQASEVKTAVIATPKPTPVDTVEKLPETPSTVAKMPEVAPRAQSMRALGETTYDGEREMLRAVDEEVLRRAVSGGMRLYLVDLTVGADIQDKGRTFSDITAVIESVGKPLWTSADQESFDRLNADTVIRTLIATVLSQDMISVALAVPESRCHALDMERIKDGLKSQQVVSEDAVMTQDAMPITDTVAPKTSEPPEMSNPRSSAPAPKAGNDALRVRLDLLTKLMNMAGELVLGRNQLLRALEHKAEETPGLIAILQHVDRVTTELQEGIMQTRMQPIGVLFNRYQRVARDMARALGKEIKLDTEGADVELDRSIIELLSDPLTHIIRNCVDHAIETPDERESRGKNRTGQVTLTAFHEGGQVNIIVSDDGRGIATDKVLKKAIEKGLIEQSDAHKLSHREIVHLVMAPGFSTAEKVTDISGRGVGMDVVRNNIEKLGGNIEIETSEGMGTTVLLRLPLTLAIIPSLIVGVQEARFAVPQVAIVELVLVREVDVPKRIELIGGAPTLRLRGKLLPLVRLADLLGIKRAYTDPETGETKPDRRQQIADRRSPSDARIAKSMDQGRTKKERDAATRRESWQNDYNILVLRAGTNQFGVIVDELFDIEEIVVKPLSTYLKDTKCFAGTTILGDGRVIMILDTGGIAEVADLKFSDLQREEARRKANTALKTTSIRSVILFNSALDEVFAVPQDKVLRLERIHKSDIQRMGNQNFIKYRGAGLPVVKLDDYMPVRALSDDADELFLIIPKYTRNKVAGKALGGIMASKIIDAMDVEVEMQRPFFEGPGLEGVAIVDDKLTMFLDPIVLLDTTGIATGDVS